MAKPKTWQDAAAQDMKAQADLIAARLTDELPEGLTVVFDSSPILDVSDDAEDEDDG